MFKCRNSQICLHTEDVCNGYVECPHREDEILCELSNLKCLDGCVCLKFAIMCKNATLLVNNTLPYISYHISLSNIQNLKFLLENKN